MKEDPLKNDRRALDEGLKQLSSDWLAEMGFDAYFEARLASLANAIDYSIEIKTNHFGIWLDRRIKALEKKYNCGSYKSALQLHCEEAIKTLPKREPYHPKVVIPVFDPGTRNGFNVGFSVVTLLWSPHYPGAHSGNWTIRKDVAWYRLEERLESPDWGIPQYLQAEFPNGSVY